jgi:hypothetical protein
MCRLLGYTDINDYNDFINGDKFASQEQIEALLEQFKVDTNGKSLTAERLLDEIICIKLIADYGNEMKEVMFDRCAEGSYEDEEKADVMDVFSSFLWATRAIKRCEGA